MHLNWKLFLTFVGISLASFGGGYAITPHLQRELVEKKDWITSDDLGELFSVAQCTPGLISVNAATYVGTKVGGTSGAICATLGIITPPIFIIVLVASFFWPYLSNPWVKHATAGLQACVCALILRSVITLFCSTVLRLSSVVLFLGVLAASFFTDLSPAILILAAGLTGLLFHRWKGGRNS